MVIRCYWDCPHNKDGDCLQPRGIRITLDRNGSFTCNKLSEAFSKSYDLKETH